MEAIDTINILIQFVSDWLGTTIPRIIVAFIGLLCIFLTVVRWWERRIKALMGAFGLFVGFLMVILALNPTLIYILARTKLLLIAKIN